MRISFVTDLIMRNNHHWLSMLIMAQRWGAGTLYVKMVTLSSNWLIGQDTSGYNFSSNGPILIIRGRKSYLRVAYVYNTFVCLIQSPRWPPSPLIGRTIVDITFVAWVRFRSYSLENGSLGMTIFRSKRGVVGRWNIILFGYIGDIRSVTLRDPWWLLVLLHRCVMFSIVFEIIVCPTCV